jgi:predicted nucleic-acid-binding Zn-ribbon protein
MPEIHPVKRLRLWTVTAAADQGQILVVTCNRCRITRNYLPADIAKLCGNPSLDRLLQKFRCDGCGQKNYLQMKLHFPHGSEYGILKIRRLRRIRTVTVPVWTDDVLR